MPTAIEHLGAKIYLIYTPSMPRPFLTTVPFVARDFASWGYRVDQHASDSPYIAEIRAREKAEHAKRKGREVSQRTKLMEMWAREIIERKREREARRADVGREEDAARPNLEAENACGFPDARMKRTGKFVHDFLNAINESGECGCEEGTPPKSKDGTNQSKGGKDVVRTKPSSAVAPEGASRICEHVRYLCAIRFVPNASLPEWTHPSISYADMVVLEYRPSKTTVHDDYLRALGRAIGKNEKRMGKVESYTGTGATKVYFWTEVGDVVPEANRHHRGDVEDVDPVPRYERGEGPPVYV